MKRSLILLGTTLLFLSASAALADTFVMQCNKSNCVRARCDDWHENCSTAGYFKRSNGAYSVPHSQQVCNEFGDCHFALPSYPQTGATETPAPAAAPPAPAAAPMPIVTGPKQ